MSRRRGGAPGKLTGQLPVSADLSPWWVWVASEIWRDADLVGKELPIEEITQTIPSYPDGRRPRPRTTARRLLQLGAIEVVNRGPNGSLGKGATYKILPERPSPPAGGVEPLPDNVEFLEEAVERMTRDSRDKG